MDSWILALAASAFWAGVLVEGVGRRGPPAGVAAALLATGLALLCAGLVGGISSRRANKAGLVGANSTGRQRRAALRWGRSLVAFGLLGSGWAGVHEAGVRGSVIARLAGRSAELEGALSTDPRPSGLGWSASLSV